MRKSQIEDANRYQLKRHREFRVAADIIAAAFQTFPEVAAVALIGSVAKPLWKEVPRFRGFRSKRIEIWHECKDVDLAVWIDSLARLGELRRARDVSLRKAFESGVKMSVANHQAEVFLIEPGSDRYLGRLCNYNACPKGKPNCRVPGCGAVRFNKTVEGFEQRPDLLANARQSMLYERGKGILMSALDLPVMEDLS